MAENTFSPVKLTTKGLRLLAKAQAGAELKITKAVIGDGSVTSEAQILSLTSVVHEVRSHQTGGAGTSATVDIEFVEAIGDGGVIVRVRVKNGDTAFYFRELGLMAYDPDEKKDILYAYTNAGDGAALMPDNSAYVVRTLDLALNVSNAANITANVTHKAEVMRDEFTEHTANTGNPHKVTAAQLFPSNSTVLNGIKATDVTKWNGMIPTTQKGAASGVAELDSNGKVPSGQLPSYVDDVLEYETKAKFPSKGESGKIYVDTTANLTYRWSGSQYVEISQSLALGETAQTAYRGDRGKTAYDHSQTAHAPTTAATQSAAGLMSAADKKKLDGIAEGAQKHITPTKNEVVTALGYTPPSKDTTYNAATQSADGLMSAADKKKLDGVEAGAQKHIAPTKTEVVNALGYTPPEKDTIIPVDTVLSETSANPVRNSMVTKAINTEKSIREEALDTLAKEVRDVNKVEIIKTFSLTFAVDYFYNNRDGTQGGTWKCTDLSKLYESIKINNKSLQGNGSLSEMEISYSPISSDVRIEVIVKINLEQNTCVGYETNKSDRVTDEDYPYIISATNSELEIALGLVPLASTDSGLMLEVCDSILYSAGTLLNLKTSTKGSLLGAVNELVDVNETKLEHRFVSELPNTEIKYNFEEAGAASVFIGTGKGSVGIGTEENGNKYNYIRMNSSGTGSSDVYRATFDFSSHITDDVYKITVSFDAYWNTSTACRDAILIGDKAKLESNVSSFNDSVGAAFYFASTGTNTLTVQNNAATARNTEEFYSGWVKYNVVIDLKNKRVTYEATPINGGTSFKGDNAYFKDTSVDTVNCIHIRTRIAGEEIRVDNISVIMHSTATENKLYLMETENGLYNGYVYKNGIAEQVITVPYYYGECSETDGYDREFTYNVDIPGFVLYEGAVVRVKFANKHQHYNATSVYLNVSGTGAKPLIYAGTTPHGTGGSGTEPRNTVANSWVAGEVVEFQYIDGQWNALNTKKVFNPQRIVVSKAGYYNEFIHMGKISDADYICHGDDDTEVIQKAINACAYGGTIFFTGGSYAIRSKITVSSPEKITFEGFCGSMGKGNHDAASTGDVCLSFLDTGQLYMAKGSIKLRFKNLSLHSDTSEYIVTDENETSGEITFDNAEISVTAWKGQKSTLLQAGTIYMRNSYFNLSSSTAERYICYSGIRCGYIEVDNCRIVLRNAAANTGNDLNFIYSASSGGVIRNSILVNDTNKESAAYKGRVNFICPGISVENCTIDMDGNRNGNICHYSTDVESSTIFSNNIVTYYGTTTLAFDVISGNVFKNTYTGTGYSIKLLKSAVVTGNRFFGRTGLECDDKIIFANNMLEYTRHGGALPAGSEEANNLVA